MIYLDNAATTFPKPPQVSRAVYRFMIEKSANPGRSGHKMSMAAAETVYQCRSLAADFFHASGPENVAFMLNATMSINAALKGVLKSGDHVVISCLEHNAVMRPLYKLIESGVSYDAAQVDFYDDAKTIDNFEKLIKPNTAMIACTHASNICGRVLPIEMIGKLCKKRGLIFLVDASQTAGVLPIDMQACNIDFLCMPGHKSLYGPMGTGLLITSEKMIPDTIMEGGTGSNSVSLAQPEFMPDRMESGTVNAPGIAGLKEGIKFVQSHGIKQIYSKEMTLAQALFDRLKNIPGIKLYTPRPEEGYVPVFGFNIGDVPSDAAVSRLDSMGFALRGGLHCSPAAHAQFGTLDQGMIRVSIGAFNTMGDILRLSAAVKKLAVGQKHFET